MRILFSYDLKFVQESALHSLVPNFFDWGNFKYWTARASRKILNYETSQNLVRDFFNFCSMAYFVLRDQTLKKTIAHFFWLRVFFNRILCQLSLIWGCNQVHFFILLRSLQYNLNVYILMFWIAFFTKHDDFYVTSSLSGISETVRADLNIISSNWVSF